LNQYIIFEKQPISIHQDDVNIGVNIFHRHLNYIYIDDYKFILNNLYNRQAYNMQIILDYPKLSNDMKMYCNRLDKAKLSKFCQYYKNVKNITKDCSILDTRLAKIVRMIDKDGKFIYPNKIERHEQNEIQPANIIKQIIPNTKVAGTLDDFLDTDTENDFKKYVENKSVIVVIHSTVLENKKLGEFIDSHDIVIRISNGCDIVNEDDMGSKTNILYHNLSLTTNTTYEKMNKFDWICPSENTKGKIINSYKNFHENNPDSPSKFHIINNKNYNVIRNKCNTHITFAGCLAIFDLLQYDIKSLYILGANFYKTPQKYYGSINDECLERIQTEVLNHNTRYKDGVLFHNIDGHINYLLEVMKNDNRIKIDNTLKNILQEYYIKKETVSICITQRHRINFFDKEQNKTIVLLPNLLKSVINSIENTNLDIFYNFEFVISNWDKKEEKLLHSIFKKIIQNKIPYKIVHTDGEFHRGTGRTVAADNSDGEIILFLDTDMLFDETFLLNGISAIEKNNAYFPICFYFLNSSHTIGFYDMGGTGNSMVKRNQYLSVNKFPRPDSGYHKHNGEDYLFYSLIKSSYNVEREINKNFFHVYHPGPLVDRYKNNKLKKAKLVKLITT